MCSKPISASAGKGGRICSGPLTTCKCKQGNIAGPSTPLFSAQTYHTVLLFASPTANAKVCCAELPGQTQALTLPTGLHQAHLRQAFATARPVNYEWQEDTCVRQTTLLPLTNKEGHVDEVLSVTRDISAWSIPAKQAEQALHEGEAPHTFAQLLLAARETEKREIAKALHDEIGTASVMLSALVSMTKQSVQKGNTAQALKDLERLQTQTQHSIERLRNIIVSLRPPSLDTDGALRGSIEELVREVCNLGRLKYRFVCSRQMPERGISDRVKILLYRLVQESLSNVIKHAQAHQVTVQLKRQHDEMFVNISDDGIGFKNTQRRSINHVGLRSMQDSIRLLGGSLKISSAPGKGTHIKVACPCTVYEENYD